MNTVKWSVANDQWSVVNACIRAETRSSQTDYRLLTAIPLTTNHLTD